MEFHHSSSIQRARTNSALSLTFLWKYDTFITRYMEQILRKGMSILGQPSKKSPHWPEYPAALWIAF